MNDQQLLRYNRHIFLNEIGIEGHMSIMRSSLAGDPCCRVCGKSPSGASANNPVDASPQHCSSASCSC